MTMKSILITGCSSGIGLETAHLLKKRGYRVFASARKLTDVETLVSQGFEAIQLDVNGSHSIQQGVSQVLALTNGRIDALFNNAGFLQAGAVEDVSREQDREQFETNVFGAMEVIRQVLPVMRQQGHGRIIQNSSILGIVSIPYCGSYNASKFAIEGYCRTLRQELLGTNIYVSLINPGPIKSELRKNSFERFDRGLLDTTGIHQPAYKRLEKYYFNTDESKDKLRLTPAAVVAQVIHALESGRPKVHYYTGIAAKGLAFLRRVLPDKWLDGMLAKMR